MKIIDEKGRLFGKINLIDFLVIAFIISFLPMFYFGYRLSRRPIKEVKENKDFIEMELPCSLIKIPPETLKLIKVGDRELDTNGQTIGEIMLAGEAKPYEYKLNFFADPTRGILIKDDPVLKELPVKLKLKLEVRDNKYLFYNDTPIKYDALFNFKTDKYDLLATPNLLPQLKPAEKIGKERWIKVKVRFTGLSPELADIINKGHIEKDSNGAIVGRLEEIANRQPSVIQVVKLEENKLALINDPFRSDVTAVLNLLCLEEESGFYFKNYPIKIGGQINFTSQLYIVTGTIIDIDLKTQ